MESVEASVTACSGPSVTSFVLDFQSSLGSTRRGGVLALSRAACGKLGIKRS